MATLEVIINNFPDGGSIKVNGTIVPIATPTPMPPVAGKILTPSGGDDYTNIQNAINDNSSLKAIGNFFTSRTIKMKSNFSWELDGSLKLMDNSNVDMITNNGALSNLTMKGGIYDGNLARNTEIRVIDFQQLNNSHFSDMVCQNGGKGFTIARGCSRNVFDRIVGKNCGTGATTSGNGLGDRGDHNTWNDCIAENNWSDNFIIKCRDSVFNRCIARGSRDKVGFGIYARREGMSVDTGEDVSRNKFYACKAYDNNSSGFSLNIGTTCPDGLVEGNYIEVEAYNNNVGVNFRNAISSGIIRNNFLKSTVHDNRLKGLGFEGSYLSKVTGNTGAITVIGTDKIDTLSDNPITTIRL